MRTVRLQKTPHFDSSIADLLKFEYTFWKKEQFPAGKDILSQKGSAILPGLCYTYL